MALQAATLNKRMTLQTVTRTPDTGGGATEAWGNTAALWAGIDELSGSEGYESQQIASRITHKVTIRYRTGVSPQQRIPYGARVLKIEGVLNPGQRNESLELLCVEENI